VVLTQVGSSNHAQSNFLIHAKYRSLEMSTAMPQAVGSSLLPPSSRPEKVDKMNRTIYADSRSHKKYFIPDKLCILGSPESRRGPRMPDYCTLGCSPTEQPPSWGTSTVGNQGLLVEKLLVSWLPLGRRSHREMFYFVPPFSSPPPPPPPYFHFLQSISSLGQVRPTHLQSICTYQRWHL
jgi:hypothetical protein